MPAASAASGFSPKGGDLPLFKAYAGDPKAPSPTVLGYAFYTTELQPLERAYDGPIKWLVGMNTAGVLTGVILIEHNEGKIYRFKPRANAAINKWWITDEVRYGWKHVHSDKRLTTRSPAEATSSQVMPWI